MKLKILDAKESEINLQGSVQSNGKINVSAAAISILNPNNKMNVKIAVDEYAKSAEESYIQLLNNITDGIIKANKAGNYYYFNANSLADNPGLDYKAHSVIFDIARTEEVIGGLPHY